MRHKFGLCLGMLGIFSIAVQHFLVVPLMTQVECILRSVPADVVDLSEETTGQDKKDDRPISSPSGNFKGYSRHCHCDKGRQRLACSVHADTTYAHRTARLCCLCGSRELRPEGEPGMALFLLAAPQPPQPTPPLPPPPPFLSCSCRNYATAAVWLTYPWLSPRSHPPIEGRRLSRGERH